MGEAIVTVDECALLEFRALITAVKVRLVAKSMLPLDAFQVFLHAIAFLSSPRSLRGCSNVSIRGQVFDFDRDGVLSCGELWGGLEWLGLVNLKVFRCYIPFVLRCFTHMEIQNQRRCFCVCYVLGSRRTISMQLSSTSTRRVRVASAIPTSTPRSDRVFLPPPVLLQLETKDAIHNSDKKR